MRTISNQNTSKILIGKVEHVPPPLKQWEHLSDVNSLVVSTASVEFFNAYLHDMPGYLVNLSVWLPDEQRISIIENFEIADYNPNTGVMSLVAGSWNGARVDDTPVVEDAGVEFSVHNIMWIHIVP